MNQNKQNPKQQEVQQPNVEEVTLSVPLAIRQLVESNNQLLKNYQQELLNGLEQANAQMMNILQLDRSAGWRLDLDRLVYTRPKTEDEIMAQRVESSDGTLPVALDASTTE